MEAAAEEAINGLVIQFQIIDTYLTVYFIYSTLYRFIMCILFDFWLLQKAKMDFFLQFSYYLVQDKGRDNGNEADEREQEQLR